MRERKKPGKVPGPAETVRRLRVQVLVNQAEYDALANAADAARLPMAEVLRQDARAAGHLPASRDRAAQPAGPPRPPAQEGPVP